MAQAGAPAGEQAAVRTFLIADVRGYTRFTLEQGDEAAARLATRFAGIAELAVRPHEGEVLEVRGDEVLAVFRSARHALQAATNLQHRLAEEMAADGSLPLLVGVGLDAGEAIPVDGGFRGAALNLAARLCSLAGPGEVLASEAVTHLARRVTGLRYTDRGAVQLKGFTEPVRVLAVQTEEDAEPLPSTATTPAPLPIGGFLGALPAASIVSRKEELERIGRIVEAVMDGAGRVVLLAGEPGIGKTRLAQELTMELRNQGFLVSCGRCYESQASVPFYPFLEALATLYGAAPAYLRSQAAQRWPYLGRLLPSQLATTVPPAGQTAEEQQRLFHAVTDFLETVAETLPVALLLDDLHWADAASLALVAHLARQTRAHRILLLGTYRDVEVGRQHPLERALRDLGREGLAERVAVRRLDAGDTAVLLARTLGIEAVSEELSALIYRHTEGNPFFTQEVLRTLVERGDIFRREGTWDRRAVEEIVVPESVRSTIGERLTRLSEGAQELLREASVLGTTFEFEHLLAMGERSEAELEGPLEEAMGTGLIREGEGDAYAFNHALTQAALYAELPRRRRRRLHLAAAEGMERAERPVRAAELAWHFLSGDASERALPCALRAGDEAAAVFAHAEAEQQYRTAAELARDLGDHSTQAAVRLKLGVVLTNAGRLDEALVVLEEAVELYRMTNNAVEEARAVAQIGRVQARSGVTEEGIARLRGVADRVERMAEATPMRSSVLAELSSALTHLYFAAGRYVEQLQSAERAAELARALHDERILVDAEMRRGLALGMLGRREEATHAWIDTLPMMEALDDLYNLSHTLNNIASCCADPEQSRSYTARGLEAAERLGDPGQIAFMLCNLGGCAFASGKWDEARPLFKRAWDLAGHLRIQLSAYPALDLGCLELAEGNVAEGRRWLEECIAIARRGGDLQALRMAHLALAGQDLRDGSPELAQERLQPLMDRVGLEEAGVTSILPMVAEVRLEMGDDERAEEIARQGQHRATSQGAQDALLAILIVRGKIATYRSQWEEAERFFDESLILARRLSSPYGEARALYESGLMRGRQGEPERARRRLEEALGIFHRLGAKQDFERAQRALSIPDQSPHPAR